MSTEQTLAPDKRPVTEEARNKPGGGLAIVSILALGAVLRLYHLTHESFWIDEGCSLRDAMGSINAAKASKPLYYFFLHHWMGLGTSEVMLRLPSVIFALISIYLIYAIGRDLISKNTGLIAALFLAVSPFIIDHSQEVRMYTLLLMNSLAAVYFFLKFIKQQKTSYAIGYTIFAILSLLTQPMAVFLVVTLNLAFVLEWPNVRKKWPLWALCQFVTLAAWAPVIPYILGFGNFVKNWDLPGEKLNFRHIPLFWSWFVTGYWNRLVYPDKLLLRYGHYVYAYVITLIMFTAMIIHIRKKEARFLGLWLLCPLAIILILSAVSNKTWMPRYLLYMAPSIYLLLGLFLSSMRRNVMIFGTICLLLLPLFRLDRYYANTERAQWRQAVQYLEQNAGSGDFIGIYKPFNEHVFRYYYHGKAPWKPLGMIYKTGDLVNYEPPSDAYLAVRSLPKDRATWLVISRIKAVSKESIEREIELEGRLIGRKEFFEITIFHLKPVKQKKEPEKGLPQAVNSPTI